MASYLFREWLRYLDAIMSRERAEADAIRRGAVAEDAAQAAEEYAAIQRGDAAPEEVETLRRQMRTVP